MIVEDEALIALSLQTKLESFGYSIPAVAHNGEEAIQLAGEVNPDLILMDINLPGGMSGITAAEKIRSTKKVPILFLTAYSDDTTLQKAMSAEPFGYLIKPFRERELRSAIEVALHKHKHEVLELDEALKKATEGERLKKAFLVNLSHEIRTPMNGILGFTDLLKSTGFDPEMKQEIIKNIETSGDRLLKTFSELIDISKIEAGDIKIVERKTDVAQLLQTKFEATKDQAEEKGLALRLILPYTIKRTFITTDADLIGTTLDHLLNNAIKFTEKGKVEFGFEELVSNKDTNEIRFFVRDTGVGIAKEQQSVIFERFRQVDENSQRVFEGSGLGLSIAKAFVELLGGNIMVESELGRGAVFSFTIPDKL